MKNDNRKKCRKNIELFNGETWRGAESLQARFVEEYRRFFEKHHIFKATGGAIMGGRMEGRFFVYMEGRWRGAQCACEAIFSSKNVIFEVESLFEHQTEAPLHAPPIF